MKNLVAVILLSSISFGCRETKTEKKELQKEEPTMVGHWDNFQQYWLENTATKIHHVRTSKTTKTNKKVLVLVLIKVRTGFCL